MLKFTVSFFTFSQGVVCTVGESIEDRNGELGRGVLIVVSNKGIPCDGKLSQWEFWTETSGRFRALVVRREVDASNFTIIGINDINVTSEMANRKSAYLVPEKDQIAVKKNDMIAINTFKDVQDDPRIQVTTNAGNVLANFFDPTFLVVGGTLPTDSWNVTATYSVLATITGTGII